jgi:hypothetical protein
MTVATARPMVVENGAVMVRFTWRVLALALFMSSTAQAAAGIHQGTDTASGPLPPNSQRPDFGLDRFSVRMSGGFASLGLRGGTEFELWLSKHVGVAGSASALKRYGLFGASSRALYGGLGLSVRGRAHRRGYVVGVLTAGYANVHSQGGCLSGGGCGARHQGEALGMEGAVGWVGHPTQSNFQMGASGRLLVLPASLGDGFSVIFPSLNIEFGLGF